MIFVDAGEIELVWAPPTQRYPAKSFSNISRRLRERNKFYSSPKPPWIACVTLTEAPRAVLDHLGCNKPTRKRDKVGTKTFPTAAAKRKCVRVLF